MVVIGKNSHNELSVAAAEQKNLGPLITIWNNSSWSKLIEYYCTIDNNKSPINNLITIMKI